MNANSRYVYVIKKREKYVDEPMMMKFLCLCVCVFVTILYRKKIILMFKSFVKHKKWYFRVVCVCVEKD